MNGNAPYGTKNCRYFRIILTGEFTFLLHFLVESGRAFFGSSSGESLLSFYTFLWNLDGRTSNGVLSYALSLKKTMKEIKGERKCGVFFSLGIVLWYFRVDFDVWDFF